jgi:hypothetical protein
MVQWEDYCAIKFVVIDASMQNLFTALEALVNIVHNFAG